MEQPVVASIQASSFGIHVQAHKDAFELQDPSDPWFPAHNCTTEVKLGKLYLAGPHPSLLSIGSLRETFRGWHKQAPPHDAVATG